MSNEPKCEGCMIDHPESKECIKGSDRCFNYQLRHLKRLESKIYSCMSREQLRDYYYVISGIDIGSACMSDELKSKKNDDELTVIL